MLEMPRAAKVYDIALSTLGTAKIPYDIRCLRLCFLIAESKSNVSVPAPP